MKIKTISTGINQKCNIIKLPAQVPPPAAITLFYVTIGKPF